MSDAAGLKNILFIMCDQLRWDALGCAGHPALETPAIDALAARGVRFTRAYCQSPVCGPSRMSFYTGRYVASHGATWNNVPLSVCEHTMGEYLRALGVRTALAGKTHFRADIEGMARLGIDPHSPEGVLLGECGFEPYARDDGLYPGAVAPESSPYVRFLRAQGYAGANPWHDFANSAAGPGGEVLSGWAMRHAALPARIDRAHSETAFMSTRAIDFIRAAGDTPWCLHLSFIKPHWPYIAPAPYHALYGPDAVPPANRGEGERADPHPVFAAYLGHAESRSFARDEVRRTVIPAYLGLIREIDDNLARVVQALIETGAAARTLIVFTSDHGDYLGDHWLGEKELFFEESVRIPLIIVDPSPAADATRGGTCDALVESIDLLPTFIEALGGPGGDGQRLEGRSLLSLLHGTAPPEWRDAVFSELDYAFRPARQTLARSPTEARATMVRTRRWKLIEYLGFRPQLFDLENDPFERHDLGADPVFDRIRAEMRARLVDWHMRRRTRRTIADATIAALPPADERGILVGRW